MSKAEEFYGNGAGDRLIEQDNYPPAVKEYLLRENELISDCFNNGAYQLMIEAGCMNARHLQLAVELGVGYLGIDVVERYIKEAKARIQTIPHSLFAEAECLSVEKLPELKRSLEGALPWPDGKVLVVFPFNSFGNLENPQAALGAVASCGFDALILTYHTDRVAREIRMSYYSNCGYKNLRCLETEEAVRFISDDGLNSVAFSEIFFKKLLSGFTQVEVIHFSALGVGYLARAAAKDELSTGS